MVAFGLRWKSSDLRCPLQHPPPPLRGYGNWFSFPPLSFSLVRFVYLRVERIREMMKGRDQETSGSKKRQRSKGEMERKKTDDEA